MCTDRELKNKLACYANIASQLKKLESEKKELSIFIIEEMDKRQDTMFEGVKIISERLTETATKAGKDYLKRIFSGDTIDKYITISLSQYVNTRSLNKLF